VISLKHARTLTQDVLAAASALPRSSTRRAVSRWSCSRRRRFEAVSVQIVLVDFIEMSHILAIWPSHAVDFTAERKRRRYKKSTAE
jgi:hypothetical protein